MLPGSTAAPSGFAGLNDKRPPATKYNRSAEKHTRTRTIFARPSPVGVFLIHFAGPQAHWHSPEKHVRTPAIFARHSPSSVFSSLLMGGRPMGHSLWSRLPKNLRKTGRSATDSWPSLKVCAAPFALGMWCCLLSRESDGAGRSRTCPTLDEFPADAAMLDHCRKHVHQGAHGHQRRDVGDVVGRRNLHRFHSRDSFLRHSL